MGIIESIRHNDEWYNEMDEKESFFKCLGSETALTVLSYLTLKYTNTLDFNDPFDYNPAFTNQGLSKFMKRVGENNNIRIPRKIAIKNSKFLTTDEVSRRR